MYCTDEKYSLEVGDIVRIIGDNSNSHTNLIGLSARVIDVSWGEYCYTLQVEGYIRQAFEYTEWARSELKYIPNPYRQEERKAEEVPAQAPFHNQIEEDLKKLRETK